MKLDKTSEEMDLLKKNVVTILNKLTPQKFDILVEKFNALPIDSQTKLQVCIELIFEQAMDKPDLSVVYAKMCQVLLMKKVLKDDSKTETVNFRKQLIMRCQKEFEKDYMESQDYQVDKEKYRRDISATSSEDERKQIKAVFELMEMKLRQRSLNNIRFLGELYKLQTLTARIMHECVRKLLKTTDEESLECLVRLLTTVGEQLDMETKACLAKGYISGVRDLVIYFSEMSKISQDKKICSRVRFLIQEVIELRKADWKLQREVDGPRNIDEIHMDTEKEALSPSIQANSSGYEPQRRDDRGRQDEQNITDLDLSMGTGMMQNQMEYEAKEKVDNLRRLMQKKHKREIHKEKNVISVRKAEDIEGHKEDDLEQILQSLGELKMENQENVKKAKKKVKKDLIRSKGANGIAHNHTTLDSDNTNSIDTTNSSTKTQVTDVDNSVVTNDSRDKKKRKKSKDNKNINLHNDSKEREEILDKLENGNSNTGSGSTTISSNDVKTSSDKSDVTNSEVVSKFKDDRNAKVLFKKGWEQSTVYEERDVFTEEMLEKEFLLEEEKSSAGNIMSSKAKEMRKLITGAEEAEDRVTGKQKEIAELDARRSQLVKECDQDKMVMNKLTAKRRKLEEFISAEIEKSKAKMSKLRQEIAALKAKQSESDGAQANEPQSVDNIPAKPSLPPLDYINQKIEAKEKELECPVCFETASVPIFMCQELHLICSVCRPKVSECPECRLRYTGRPRRHR